MFKFINRYFGFIMLVIIFSFIGIGGITRSEWKMSVAPTYHIPNGKVEQGRAAIEAYGCGSCHTIPGIASADADVGPPLTNFGARTFVAGELSNTPDNLIFFLRNPQLVNPNTDMPDLDLSAEDAAHIAAYLYTLQN
jgi:cytochrome c2